MTTHIASGQPPIKAITIFGRRWFHRGPGNTYCTAEIYLNGVFLHKTEAETGGGDYYIQAAGDYLAKQGFISPTKHNNGSSQPLWQYCDENNIALSRSVADVPRQRDL